MRFGLYSELQLWPGKQPARLYREVLEQIEHADRLGYQRYSIIEHFGYPKFSISADPLALFSAAAQRTRDIRFRTLMHVVPLHNPMVLAARIAQADHLLDGRYEFGLARGHGWLPPRVGVPFEESGPRNLEGQELVLRALEGEFLDHDGDFFKVTQGRIVPKPTQSFRVFLGGTSEIPYRIAGERGWPVAMAPLLPFEALVDQLEIYRETSRAHGHEPDIVYIHACYIDEDIDTAHREAEQAMCGFIAGNASPIIEYGLPGEPERLRATGFGFYASGILDELQSKTYDELVEQDYVWVGTPDQIVARIEELQQKCDGLQEISITVNAGGVEHWKAIKAQEIFADKVIPRVSKPEPALSGEPLG